MKSYLEKIYETYPDWPRRIRHGEYIGILSGIQPLSGGEAAPIYRFPGGECVGVDYKIAAVRIPALENEAGVVYCKACGAELLCNSCGDMPDVCPICHEGIEWSMWTNKRKAQKTKVSLWEEDISSEEVFDGR